MTEEIQLLINSLRRGQYENPADKIGLLSAALQEAQVETALLLSLLRAPQVSLQLAAMEACRSRLDPELVAELSGMAQHGEPRIRIKLAQVLQPPRQKAVIEALRVLVRDSDEEVRIAALKSTAGCPEFVPAQALALAKDSEWEVRMAAARALQSQSSPTVLKPLFDALAQDQDRDVQQECAQLIEGRLRSNPEATSRQLPAEITRLTQVERVLKQLGARRFPSLVAWIADRTTVTVDPEALAKYGTDLTVLAAQNSLPHAYGVEEFCQSLLKLIGRERWRSIVLLGPAGVGKSALVNELTYELRKPEHGSWHVLRISPTDFIAGTRYLGEWETKVREVVEAIRKPRRVLLYVPNLSDLVAAGTWSESKSSVATALGPYLEEGSVLLLGESTADEFERGLGRIPSLQRLFDRVLLAEASVEQTRRILQAIRDNAQRPVSDEVLDQLLDVSGQFLGHVSQPGNAVELLRAVIQQEQASTQAVTFRDVLDSISKSTGLPADLLDEALPLQSAEVRNFFESKIKGQTEAIEAVVDLVTLIKAGVTDPQKPFAVFLFIGPTGVGKTELARALAEFIFGDAARLKRFDMSEFASAEGFTRLIGGPNENGLLTDTVRQHPFSVVLLDEIEKSHLNVFDLCLQIFDAGRLTDGRGRTVDFRRTIVILTSNIGSTAGGAPLGFGSGKPETAEVDKDRTFRELSRFFRPEFLNRLDRIVQFRPLSLQVAEEIARREVDLVVQRAGIRRRQLRLDVDPAVISLLVREGYSAYFGARPLKRTVERLLLLPVARAISNGSVPRQAILRLSARAGRVEALVIPPAAEAKLEKPVSRVFISLKERLLTLSESYSELEPDIRPLADRKSELILRTQEPDFFQQEEVRSATLDEIHKLDQFITLHHTLGNGLNATSDRLQDATLTQVQAADLAQRAERLAAELEHLRFVAKSKDALDLGDAVISIALLDRRGGAQDSVSTLAGMYQALAHRRKMTAEVLGEYYDDQHDRAYLLIAGLGAYAVLKHESGLHQVDRRYREHVARSGREAIREDREVVRVDVYPAGPEPSKEFRHKTKAKFTPLKPARERLLSKANLALSLFHEPSLRSIELWTAGPKEAALDRGLLILNVQLQGAVGAEAEQPRIIRQYDVGLNAKAKDTRTGRSTTRVDQVFKGDLSALVPEPGEP